MKKKGRPKSTKNSNPYRLVKRFAFKMCRFSFISQLCSHTKSSHIIIYRAGALSSLTKIEPSDGYIKDEPVVAANNVGNVAQIDGTGVEDAKTSLTEQNLNLSCSEGPEG